MGIVWVLLGIALLVVLWGVAAYNKFVQLNQNVKNGWSQIDVQLKRRHDLIPNLVEVAKGYLKHENKTLQEVIQARQMAVDARTLPEKQKAENVLTGTLRSLFMVTESYPDLKANTQMIRLQEEVTTTENRIAFSRQYYNDEVNRLNTSLQNFPDQLIGNAFHFQKADYFEIAAAAERQAPEIKF